MAGDPQMFIKIAANIEDLKTAMAQARQAVLDNTEATKHASEASAGWTGVLNELSHSFVAHVAEGVLLRDAIHEILDAVKEAIVAFPELIEHTIAVGNSLFEMAMKTGSSVEGLSALRYVASQTGIDFGTFGTTISMLEKNLGATGAAGDKVSTALSSMGLDLQTVKNMRPDEAFTAVAQALFEVKNNADKAHDAALLMGKGAKEMASLWHEDIGHMIEEAKDLGLVISTETAAGAHLAEIGFAALHLQLEAVGMTIANAFIPAIIGIEGDLREGLAEAVKTLNSQLGALGGSGGFLATVAQAMGTGDVATKAQITIYENLKEVLIGVARYGVEGLVTSTGFLLTEFQAAKVVFLDIVQVIDGVRLAYLLTQQAMALGLLPGTADLQKWKELDEQIGHLELTMKARGDGLQRDKATATDWSAWAVAANKAVEVSLNAIGNAHTDVGKKIQEMADISKAAAAGGQSEVEAVEKLTSADKAYMKAVEDLSVVGTSWKATLAGMDQGLIEDVKQMIAAGAAAKDLEIAWGILPSQMKAIELSTKDDVAALKIHDAALLETTKLWEEYAAVVAGESGSAYEKAGAAIDKWYADLIAKNQKAKTDTTEFYLAIAALDDAKWAALNKNTLAADKLSQQYYEKQAAATASYYAFLLKMQAEGQDINTQSLLTAKTAADAAQIAFRQWTVGITKATADSDAALTQFATDATTTFAVIGKAAGLTTTAIAGITAALGAASSFSLVGSAQPVGIHGKLTQQQLSDYGYIDLKGNITATGSQAGYGTSGTFAARAGGGPVLPGQPYTVGERGPETLVMGSSGGTIIPNGGGGVTNIYVTAPLGSDPAAFARAIDEALMARQRNTGQRA